MRRAARSIDIAHAYFLPGPQFLRALRTAAGRGVRVRILVPDHSDVWVVKLAMESLFGRLLSAGVEVYAFEPRVLHSKTAVFDGRFTFIGSHNLDALSLSFNLECDALIDSPEFAHVVLDAFEGDIAQARKLELASWKQRSLALRALAWLAALLRGLM